MARRMDRLFWATCRVGVVGGWIGLGVTGGCQMGQAIPPPPTPAPRTAISETPGTASTRPTAGLNDPAALEARINQLVAELAEAKRAGSEVPRVSEPAGVVQSEAGGATASPTGAGSGSSVVVQAGPAPTGKSATAEPEAVLAARRDAPTVDPDAVVAPPVPPAPSPSPAESTDAPLTANQPVAISAPAINAGSPPSAGGTQVELLVAERLAKDPRDVSAQLDLAILAYLREEPSPDAAKLAPLAEEEREVVSSVIDALVNFRSVSRTNPNAMYASRVRPFAEMSDRLKLRSDLSVPVVTMASKVDSFGVYEPMPQTLSARGETVTIIYTEVANFTSRLTDKRQWETRLAGEMTLYDASGKVVWQFRPPNTLDLCRNRRTDFCVSYVVRIPAQPAGRYVLKVTVTDLNVNRVAEGVMPLESK